MISILIPTYNYNVINLVKQVHKQALDAAINFEIIVIDDCSSKKNVIEENYYINSMSYVNFQTNEINLGRTATRNLLASKAKYDLLLFLDADVLPKYNDFITRFNLDKNKNCQVIYGGVCYYNESPPNENILRWKYGRERETKDIYTRKKEPYFIISQNLLINKSVFLKINSIETNTYGLDILFSNNLKKHNIEVIHIDNPVYHLGLEQNSIFIKKSLEAVKTTFLLEEKGLLANNLRPLQKSYLKLKKARLLSAFSFFISKFKNRMERNFQSKNPNLFWFDLYRLQYYIDLKSKKSA